MLDQYGRNIHYIRLSITDRCNFRCHYCMPDGIQKCAHTDLLSYEEMARILRLMVPLGIDTVRITGGEPLVRKNLASFICKIKQIEGMKKVSITTNGMFLGTQFESLQAAGLDSVNISLDTLKRDRFKEITGIDGLPTVLSSIQLAVAKHMPVKLNCVPQAGINEDELTELAELAKDLPIEVRFIEMMPLGLGKQVKGINNTEIFQTLQDKFGTFQEIDRQEGTGPAVCYKVNGFAGSIGFISAMHGKFCHSCNRVRITSQGFLKGCLASTQGIDVRALLRNESTDNDMKEAIRQAIYQKPMEHHFEMPADMSEKNGMYVIGG